MVRCGTLQKPYAVRTKWWNVESPFLSTSTLARVQVQVLVVPVEAVALVQVQEVLADGVYKYCNVLVLYQVINILLMWRYSTCTCISSTGTRNLTGCATTLASSSIFAFICFRGFWMKHDFTRSTKKWVFGEHIRMTLQMQVTLYYWRSHKTQRM